jgi:hypothetical protein
MFKEVAAEYHVDGFRGNGPGLGGLLRNKTPLLPSSSSPEPKDSRVQAHLPLAGDAADRPRRGDDSYRMSTPQRLINDANTDGSLARV